MGVIAEITDRVAVMYAGRIVEIGDTAAILRRPRHPYTSGLMGAIPVVGGVRGKLTQIPGTMPRPGAVPAGCSFAPRCGRAIDLCRVSRPELTTDGGGFLACHRPIDQAVVP